MPLTNAIQVGATPVAPGKSLYVDVMEPGTAKVQLHGGAVIPMAFPNAGPYTFYDFVVVAVVSTDNGLEATFWNLS